MLYGQSWRESSYFLLSATSGVIIIVLIILNCILHDFWLFWCFWHICISVFLWMKLNIRINQNFTFLQQILWNFLRQLPQNAVYRHSLICSGGMDSRVSCIHTWFFFVWRILMNFDPHGSNIFLQLFEFQFSSACVVLELVVGHRRYVDILKCLASLCIKLIMQSIQKLEFFLFFEVSVIDFQHFAGYKHLLSWFAFWIEKS